jgi:Ca2+-binding RTX toxin-like protein
MAIQGTARADTLLGTEAGELIAGKAGDDVIFGFGGNDRLYGGLGADAIDGGAGYDELWGKDGQDSLSAGNGYAFIDGGRGDDLIVAGQNFSLVYGGDGNDTIVLCHGVTEAGAGDDVISTGEWDDFGWQSQASDGSLHPSFTLEDMQGPTVIYGNEGADQVDMAFRVGADGMTVLWADYTPGERLSLSIYYEDGTLMADDATAKDWLDTNDDGALTDADGDGGGLDVVYDPTRGALTIRVENDAIELSNVLGHLPIDHLDIFA